MYKAVYCVNSRHRLPHFWLNMPKRHICDNISACLKMIAGKRRNAVVFVNLLAADSKVLEIV